MMMDAVQTAAPAQPTEELTELGKCLLKHEVGAKTHPVTLTEDATSLIVARKLNVSLCLGPEHLHDPVDPLLHLPVVEGHHQLSPHGLHGLLDAPAAGRSAARSSFTL